MDKLIAELKIVREKGLGELRRLDLPELTATARLLDAHEPSIEDVLREAVEQLGGRPQAAAEYDFGLVDGAELWQSSERRAKAAEIYGVSVERFRKKPAALIAERTALAIRRKVVEHGRAAVETKRSKSGQAKERRKSASKNQRRSKSKARPVLWTLGGLTALGVTITLVAFNIDSSVSNTGDAQCVIGGINFGDIWCQPVIDNADSDSIPPLTGESANLERDDKWWGPVRDMYTMQVPATSPLFNSIEDNPIAGDERNFVRVRHTGSPPEEKWFNAVQVKPGDKLTVRIYFENSCADNCPDGEIEGARMGVNIEEIDVNIDDQVHKIEGRLWGSNTPEVWDAVWVYSSMEVELDIDFQHSHIYTNYIGRKGAKVRAGIMGSQGFTIGGEELDGTIIPGYEYSGYVLLRINVYEAN